MTKPHLYKIFDDRSLESDYRTLIPLLKPGMQVLDVGCGTGAISAGIARLVGPDGTVLGMDKNEDSILSGRNTYGSLSNLQLISGDILEWGTDLRFDLIVSARALQWISDPQQAVQKMSSLLAPGGWLSVLDYNHEALEWDPLPPRSMLDFYQNWLSWRASDGLNNHISEDLAGYFSQVGLTEITTFPAHEVYERGADNFFDKVSIWTQVATKHQVEKGGFGSQSEREQCVKEYTAWIPSHAQKMVMKLTEIRGRKKE